MEALCIFYHLSLSRKIFENSKKNDTVEFPHQLTVITGDNGAGKSTLLSAIRSLFPTTKWSMSQDRRTKDTLTTPAFEDKKLAYISLSDDLYKNSPEFDFDNMAVFRRARTASAGEGALLQIKDKLFKNTDADLIILDEPERGLSLRQQLVTAQFLHEFIFKNNSSQFIIATHSEHFMRLNRNVFSLNHQHALSPEKYMQWMRDPEIIDCELNKLKSESDAT